jgi:hypothetical protein
MMSGTFRAPTIPMIISSVRQGIAHKFTSVKSGFAAHQFDPTGLHARHEPSGTSRIAYL